MLHSRRIASEGLQLRAWAARRLLGDGGAGEPPPAASTEGWRLFLWWERCAALLQHSVAANPVALPAVAEAEIRRQALMEMRRILSVRAQLRRVAGIAEELGIPVIVLKGTADVARGLDILTMDVDILTPEAEAERFAARLDADGFEPKSGRGHWHLEARTDVGALQVELHRAVTGFDQPSEVPWQHCRPIDSYGPLLALAPADHGWTVLCQAVRKHPDRRLRIRDLYLIRAALSRCSSEEHAQLVDRARQDPYGPAALQMIRRAEAGGVVQAGEAAYRRLRRMYLLQSRRIEAPPGSIRNRLWLRAVEIVATGEVDNYRRFRRTHAFARRGPELLRTPVRVALMAIAAAGARLLTFDSWIAARGHKTGDV